LGYSRPTNELTQSLTVLAWFLTGKIMETGGKLLAVPVWFGRVGKCIKVRYS